MKIVRFEANGSVGYGILEGSVIKALERGPFEPGWDKNAPCFSGATYLEDEVKLLVPCEPTKYVGVGLNFSSAAEALGRECPSYPITFIKPTGAIIATGESVMIPDNGNEFLYEGEMAVVIGKTAKGVCAAEAREYILGCTCSNDITDKAQFGKDDLKLKGADTFGPVGPCIQTDTDPDDCVIRSWRNGELRQEGNACEMTFSAAYIIEFLSSYMTLYPGDVISLGTPAGVGPIKPGDTVCVEVEGVGKLVNYVKEMER